MDAIAIGAATARIDDPLLTARDVYRHRPLLRVVFDRHVSLSPSSRLAGSLDAGPVVVMADGSQRVGAAAAGLRDRGVEVLATDGTIAGALGALVKRGVHSLLVEGGPTLQAACWAAGVVDRVSQLVGDRAFGPVPYAGTCRPG